ncbi:MAG: hypothetical protein KIS67_00845 [Verrucomicrobiae bacterium]|nr:hypothetical protein [Verrucomicrobiae bacterium]
MKSPLVILFGVVLAVASPAATSYVDVNSTNPTPPYTNWATAATVIQDAIDVAVAGDEILVANGIYATGGRAVFGTMTNRVAVDKPITVRSVNGPAATLIKGYQVTGAVLGDSAIRCVYLTNGASILGFTLANGATQAGQALFSNPATMGGGTWCEAGAVVSNCVVTGNVAFLGGGGAYRGTFHDCTLSGNRVAQAYGWGGGGVLSGTLYRCTLTGNSSVMDGGGACQSTLTDCILTGNSAEEEGGGAAYSTLSNCTLSGNSAYYLGGGASGCTLNGCTLQGNSVTEQGGGALFSLLNNCTLISNSATYDGGGASFSTLNNCTLTGNSAGREGGGAGFSTLNNCTLNGNSASQGGGAYAGTLNNCIVISNSAPFTGLVGQGGGVFNASLNNCTLTDNWAELGGGAESSALNNCVVYYNTAPSGSNYSAGMLSYSCTAPLPGGIGNFTNAPQLASGTFRLLGNSPCINAGRNGHAPEGPDLDGKPRIVGGTVDVGAYEFQTPASVISYAWLQQYGLSINGSADFSDSDGEGMNNWQEWRADTVPTNALSALKLSAPAARTSGVELSWTSVNTRSYWVERATDLDAQPVFSIIASNLPGQPITTSYLDTTAISSGPYFYRVGVQP